jgi:hypothetical protein
MMQWPGAAAWSAAQDVATDSRPHWHTPTHLDAQLGHEEGRLGRVDPQEAGGGRLGGADPEVLVHHLWQWWR